MSAFWTGKRVVVPGGAGLVGSAVVDALVARGAQVRIIDNLSSGSWHRLAHHTDGIDRLETDLTSGAAAIHFQHADLVIDCAGCAPGLTTDPGRHQLLHQQNLQLADAVREAALEARVPRLVVISSSCVYPDDAPVPTPELPLDGTAPESANRGYGQAKREIESRATAAADAGHTAVTIARLFNICSPRDTKTGPGAHVIPALLERILDPTHEQITVWGSGRQTRSFIDSRDAATALLLLAEHHPTPDPVNVGTNHELAMHELVSQLMSLSGIEKPVLFDTSKPEGALRKSCDANKLVRLTGFHPAHAPRQSLRDIVHARLGNSAP